MPIPSLSIIIPVRNESGHLAGLVERFTGLAHVTKEVIFVEGHSEDDTWNRVQEIVIKGVSGFSIRAIQQTGIGKGDAVRAGFALAQGEVLAIFDADLSTRPEDLAAVFFRYTATPQGLLMGERFSLPMEAGAMRPLNKLGNRFFALLLGWITGNRFSDVLCGTKLLRAEDFRRILSLGPEIAERDPFGDFHLILGSWATGLPIRTVPISYRARSYGSTNIQRFRDGWRLLLLVVTTTRALRLQKRNHSDNETPSETSTNDRAAPSRNILR